MWKSLEKLTWEILVSLNYDITLQVHLLIVWEHLSETIERQSDPTIHTIIPDIDIPHMYQSNDSEWGSDLSIPDSRRRSPTDQRKNAGEIDGKHGHGLFRRVKQME